MGQMGDAEKQIGKLIANNLVDDGSTMQMGTVIEYVSSIEE